MNSIAGLAQFRASSLAHEFQAEPLGFVDVGSLGGVHAVVDPVAQLVHALCFEPDPEGFELLRAKYASPAPYAGVSLERIALAGDTRAKRTLHVSVTPTNTSLLEPNPVFINRYRAHRFMPSHVVDVATTTLDEVVFSGRHPGRFGEFMKIDTQGSEHEILQGASRVLSERCVAVFCEVEFFNVYRDQKTLADITCLLREHGLALYALYPHYRSAGTLDRRTHDTEERLMWADAVFFKDPLDDMNLARPFSARNARALILCAMTMRFYDFALELAGRFVEVAAERSLLTDAIQRLARTDRDRFLADYRQVKDEIRSDADFLKLAKFVETHRFNSSTEHLWAPTPGNDGGSK